MLMKKIFYHTCLMLLASLVGLNASFAQILVTASYTQAACDHDGVVTATVTGGTPPYNYTWNLSVPQSGSPIYTTTNILTNLSGASGWLTVSDATGQSGQSAWANFSAAYPFALNISSTPANCPLNNGTITVSIPSGGTAPFTYQWYNNGALIAGATSNTLTGLAPGGLYDAEVTDANGCGLLLSDVDSVQFLTIGSISNIQGNPTSTVANCNNGTASVNPTGGTSPYSYVWNDYTSSILLPTTTNTATNLIAGHTYQVGITDANGCSLNQYIYISPSINLWANTQTTAENCSYSDGTATVIPPIGTTAPYTFSWNTNPVQTTQTATGLTTGSYTCYILSANGCEITAYPYVPLISPINVSYNITPTNSCANPDGTATLTVTGGTAPYVYSWANGQTTSTATGLNTGQHAFSVTDANGCERQGLVTITYSGGLQANITTTPDLCASGNGTATANVSGGLAPYTYSWFNSQTTQSVSNLNTGTYNCIVTDANACYDLGYGYVSYYSPITLSISFSNASCIYVADGSITISAAGGTAPYTYTLLNNNLSQTSPTFSGLATGTYYIKATDANGCYSYYYNGGVIVGYNGIAACSGTIAGVVYDDVNQNCVQDAGEIGIPNIQVAATNLGTSVWTNNAGYYTMTVPVGTHNVQHYPSLYHKAKCPVSGIQSVTVAAFGSVVMADFADSTTLVQDLRVSGYNVNNAVPGFLHHKHIVYQNVGTIPITNADPRHVSDVQINFNSSAPNATGTVNTTNEYTFGPVALQPYTLLDVYAHCTVPTTVPLGTILTYQDSVLPLANDVTYWDNTRFYQTTVIGAYDPNYKQVFPKGEGTEGYITVNDSILEYVIHFQNTGTYYATNVTLIDTIDEDLDLTSIEMGYSTHNYITKISQGNILEIHFPNIMLPDSGTDMAGSNGLVAFCIKQKKNLQMGTQFTNQAGIIFDFNYPIYTNTTLNTLYEPTSIEKPLTETLGLFPNPAQNVLNIEIPTALAGQGLRFECLDLTGKVVMSKENVQAGKTQLSVAELPQGWYFARVIGKNTLLNGKFVIVR